MFIPLLDGIDITGKTITADALLTQRKLARYLVQQRHAHYVFIAKKNQPTLLNDIRVFFEQRGQPGFQEPLTLAHGRLESRAIWTTTRRLRRWVWRSCAGVWIAPWRMVA